MGHNEYPENAMYYHLAKCGQTKDSTNNRWSWRAVGLMSSHSWRTEKYPHTEDLGQFKSTALVWSNNGLRRPPPAHLSLGPRRSDLGSSFYLLSSLNQERSHWRFHTGKYNQTQCDPSSGSPRRHWGLHLAIDTISAPLRATRDMSLTRNSQLLDLKLQVNCGVLIWFRRSNLKTHCPLQTRQLLWVYFAYIPRQHLGKKHTEVGFLWGFHLNSEL